jgi:hypothetical protein
MLYAPPSASTATVLVWATQVLEAIRSSLGKAKAKAAQDPHHIEKDEQKEEEKVQIRRAAEWQAQRVIT